MEKNLFIPMSKPTMMDEEYVYFQEEIHLIQDDNDVNHLTQNDYENFLNPRRQILKSYLSQESLSPSQYKVFFGSLQEDMHKKYDLRAKKKVVGKDSQVKHKKSPSNEPTYKAKEVLNTTKKNDVLDPMKGEIEHKEPDKHVSPFNIEHEKSKIKIPAPN
jgi:hypothetical protein